MEGQRGDAVFVCLPTRKLATLSYFEILELRGVPEGDWILVTNSRGDPEAVTSGASGLGVTDVLRAAWREIQAAREKRDEHEDEASA